MPVDLSSFHTELEFLKTQGLFREYRTPSHRRSSEVVLEGKRLINLSSNDYLGLASDETLTREFLQTLSDWKIGPLWGSTASRMMTGAFDVQKRLESRLEEDFPGKKILLANSGYHANLALTPALVGPSDVVFCDRLCHASLLDGIRLSGARFFRYKHGDSEHLEKLLQTYRGKFRRALIVTESVFSMEGSRTDLAALVRLKNAYGALLVVDEAHAFGILSDRGAGWATEAGLATEVDVIVGTFGKALGSVGAFFAASPVLIEVLTQKSRPLIYSTALPPVCPAWVDFLWNKKDLLAARRQRLKQRSVEFVRALGKLGEMCFEGQWIFSFVYRSNQAALHASNKARELGYYTVAIRPPTVPQNTSRLRVSLRADLEQGSLNTLAEFLTSTEVV